MNYTTIARGYHEHVVNSDITAAEGMYLGTLWGNQPIVLKIGTELQPNPIFLSQDGGVSESEVSYRGI